MPTPLSIALCGCCSPPVPATPFHVTNRPGLPAIAYRIGTFAGFRRAMLEAMADEPALAGLTTRRSDDPAITLLELWAVVADVLTFYQERIANEAFLRTATERDSVLRLARLLDYHLRPGLAAMTRLAFTADDGATVRIRAGLPVMSVPGQDEQPLTFETIEEITAAGRLNRVRVLPVPRSHNAFAPGGRAAAVIAHPTALGPGDRLALYNAHRLEEKTVAAFETSQQRANAPDPDSDTEARLEWTPPVQSSDWRAQSTHVTKLVRTFRLFGHNAPSSYRRFVPADAAVPYDRWETANERVDMPATATTYPLDARYDDIKPGARLLVDTANRQEPIRLVAVTAVEQRQHSYSSLEDTVTWVTVKRVLGSRPTVSSWGINRLDVFARGAEDTCLQFSWDGAWHGWHPVGGALTSAPAAASWAWDRIDVFARGVDGDLEHSWYDAAGWHSWESLADQIIGDPTASSWGPNRVDVFARGPQRDLRHTWFDGTWHTESLGGTLASDPGAVSWGANRIDVFARGAAGDLLHRWYDAAGWHDWESLGGEIAGTPAASSWGVNRLDVFARGPRNDLVHTWWDGAWRGWESLGGDLTSDPCAVSWGANRVDVFARGMDGGLVQEWWDGAWRPWVSLAYGLGAIENRRNVRLFQVDLTEVEFRSFEYGPTLAGGRIVAPLARLDAIDKGRAMLLQDAAGGLHAATVTGTEQVSFGSIERPDHLAIDFIPPLSAPLQRASAALLGNVARATHGQAIAQEPVGNGDATLPFQQFVLRKKPVTYVPSPRGARGESTLRVLANGQLWTEVLSLYGQPGTAPVYTTRQADDGSTTIQFGDGTTGARLPSGSGNVLAAYRQGVGLQGRLQPDRLSTLLERPVGLKKVTNPAAAEGGADPETHAQARQTAPTTVKTFGRAVSLLDFESLATASGQVGRARATWVWRRLEKAVHLTVAGQRGTTFSATALELLHAGLTQQRDPNHILLIDNVCRVPIVIAAKLIVDGRHLAESVRAAARQALNEYFAFEHRAFAQPVHLSGVYEVLQNVLGVVAVDVDLLQFKGFATWSSDQLALRGVSSAPVPEHLRLFAARPRPAAGAVADPILAACFPGALPDVLPAELAFIAAEADDISLTSVGGIE